MRPRYLLGACALLVALSAAVPAVAVTAYSIGDGGASLVRYSTSDPGSISRVGFFGGDDEFLDSIDFRPATGELFGYRHLTNSYYTVNLQTGELTLASAPSPGASTNTFLLGIDWNPTIDRMRVVTDSTQNLVFNPEDGTAASFTPLFYADGDPNEGLVPLVIENAYTNNLAGATTTQQYVLDYDLNVLATLANNAGTMNTIGEITLDGAVLDFDEFAGLDIFTRPGHGDTAFAMLTVGGVAGLYTIDLPTARASFLGALGSGFGPVYGLAVVPEPSSLALVGLGAGTLGVALVRRRRAGKPAPDVA